MSSCARSNDRSATPSCGVTMLRLPNLHTQLDDLGGYAADGARGRDPERPRIRRERLRPTVPRILRRLADPTESGADADEPFGPAAARRADEPPRPRRDGVARKSSRPVSRDTADHRARSGVSRRGHRPHGPSRVGTGHACIAATTAVSSCSAATRSRSESDTRAPQGAQGRRDHAVRRPFRAKATKARQVQSRLIALQKLQIAAPAHVDSPYQFSFPNPQRMSPTLIQVEDATLGYDGNAVSRPDRCEWRPALESAYSAPTAPARRR